MRLSVSLLLSLLIHSLLLLLVLSFTSKVQIKGEEAVRISLNLIAEEPEPKRPEVEVKKKKPPPVKKQIKKKSPKKVEKKPPKEPKEEPGPRSLPERKEPQPGRETQEKAKEKQSTAVRTLQSFQEVKEVHVNYPDRTYPVGLGEEEEEEEDEYGYQEEYEEENLSLIRDIVMSYLRYPPIARRMGWEGEVLVSFELTPEGEVRDLHIKKSSGYELLDRNTLSVVRLASKDFPRPIRPVILVIPVVYELE